MIDAAYAEYVTHNEYSPGIELVDAGENVVMTRTFSKIYALGGMRMGWAYCPAMIADVLNRIRPPFNVTSAAQAAGIAAVNDIEFLTRSRDHNTAWLPWLSERLEDAIAAALLCDRAACAAYGRSFSWEHSAQEFLAGLHPIDPVVMDSAA